MSGYEHSHTNRRQPMTGQAALTGLTIGAVSEIFSKSIFRLGVPLLETFRGGNANVFGR
jgi:hypothetical protein